ncbi:MAG: MFS transporter [Acidimicrobiia bacterium]
MLNVAVVAFEALAVTTVAPRVARDLGGTDLYGWTFAAFMLANLVGVVIVGHAADRHGPALPFIVGLSIFTTGMVVCGLAPSMPVFIAGRAVQGLGAGAMVVTAYVTIGQAFEERERPHQFALLSTAWIVPGLVSPALAGLITDAVGWRFVFLALIAMPIVATSISLPVMRTLRPSSSQPTTALPIGPAVALAIAAGLIITGLGSKSALVLGPCVAIGLLVGLPAFRTLTPPGTARARHGLPAIVATRWLETFAFFGANAFLAFSLTRVRDLSSVTVGAVLTPATLLWACGAWLQARLTGRWARRTMVTVGVATVGIATGGAALVLVRGVPTAVVAVIWATAGLGMGLSYPTTALAALSEAPAGRQGEATASLQLSDVLGQALGTGIGGALLALAAANGVARRDALAVVFGMLVLSAVLGIRTARNFPDDPDSLKGDARLREGQGDKSAPQLP